MMLLRHQRLVCTAALAAYLAVYVGARALHHHGAAGRPGSLPAPGGSDLTFQAAGQAGDCDDEETCLLCSVLHLAQTAPGQLHAEVLIVPTGEALSAPALLQPH